jgi:hypothetical protein
MTEYYYRIEDYLESSGSWDMQGEWEPGPSRLRLRVEAFEVLKHTPKGVQLRVYGERRFVLRDAYRRFACATLDEAKESFIARKEKQASIYEARARDARKAIVMCASNTLKPALFGGFSL